MHGYSRRKAALWSPAGPGRERPAGPGREEPMPCGHPGTAPGSARQVARAARGRWRPRAARGRRRPPARAGPHVARAPVKSREPARARQWRRQRPLLPPRSAKLRSAPHAAAGPGRAAHPSTSRPDPLLSAGWGLRILPARRAGIPQPRLPGEAPLLGPGSSGTAGGRGARCYR